MHSIQSIYESFKDLWSRNCEWASGSENGWSMVVRAVVRLYIVKGLSYLGKMERYTKDYKLYWKPKDDIVSLYQFMTKDNVPFHAIMFPASLLTANQGYILVNRIMAIEYLTYEDTTFPKSRAIRVFGTDERDTGIPADVWRFYLT